MRLLSWLVPAVASALLLTSCFSDHTADDAITDIRQAKDFTFHLRGDFQTCYEEMRSVRLEEDNSAGMTDIWVLDYVDGALVQQRHQAKGDADFGHPTLAISYGEHDVVFVASKGSQPSLGVSVGNASGALSWSKVMDTFVLSYPVTVTTASNGNRAPELKRSIGGVRVVMTDAVPPSAKEVSVRWSRSGAISLPSLDVMQSAEVAQSLSFPASYVGQTNKDFSLYTLVGADDLSTNLEMTFLDANGATISVVTVDGVTIKRNRMTVLTGDCFTRGDGFAISIDTSWSDEYSMTF